MHCQFCSLNLDLLYLREVEVKENAFSGTVNKRCTSLEITGIKLELASKNE